MKNNMNALTKGRVTGLALLILLSAGSDKPAQAQIAKNCWQNFKVGTTVKVEKTLTEQGKLEWSDKASYQLIKKDGNYSIVEYAAASGQRDKQNHYSGTSVRRSPLVSSTPQTKIKEEPLVIGNKRILCIVYEELETSIPMCGNDVLSRSVREILTWEDKSNGKKLRQLVTQTDYPRYERQKPRVRLPEEWRVNDLAVPITIGSHTYLCDAEEWLSPLNSASSLRWTTMEIPTGYAKTIEKRGPKEVTELVVEVQAK